MLFSFCLPGRELGEANIDGVRKSRHRGLGESAAPIVDLIRLYADQRDRFGAFFRSVVRGQHVGKPGLMQAQRTLTEKSGNFRVAQDDNLPGGLPKSTASNTSKRPRLLNAWQQSKGPACRHPEPRHRQEPSSSVMRSTTAGPKPSSAHSRLPIPRTRTRCIPIVNPGRTAVRRKAWCSSPSGATECPRARRCRCAPCEGQTTTHIASRCSTCRSSVLPNSTVIQPNMKYCQLSWPGHFGIHGKAGENQHGAGDDEQEEHDDAAERINADVAERPIGEQ